MLEQVLLSESFLCDLSGRPLVFSECNGKSGSKVHVQRALIDDGFSSNESRHEARVYKGKTRQGGTSHTVAIAFTEDVQSALSALLLEFLPLGFLIADFLTNNWPRHLGPEMVDDSEQIPGAIEPRRWRAWH